MQSPVTWSRSTVVCISTGLFTSEEMKWSIWFLQVSEVFTPGNHQSPVSSFSQLTSCLLYKQMTQVMTLGLLTFWCSRRAAQLRWGARSCGRWSAATGTRSTTTWTTSTNLVRVTSSWERRVGWWVESCRTRSPATTVSTLSQSYATASGSLDRWADSLLMKNDVVVKRQCLSS